MGVTGLYNLIKGCETITHIGQFEGQTLAVDGYAWLHKAIYTCVWELATGQDTTKYIAYFMKRIALFEAKRVQLYIVFDGAHLPSKKATELSRQESRNRAKRDGDRWLALGQRSKAFEAYQKSIDVTPLMAMRVIQELKKKNIKYIVAPYEADAQMVYLERIGAVSGIVSEDSDLLIFGSQLLITKLNDGGACIAIRKSNFHKCKEAAVSQLTDEQLRALAIFSGCDYTSGVPRVGLKTALKFIAKYKTPQRALSMMKLQFSVHLDFENEMRRANICFQHQRVFCPIEKKVKMMTPCDAPLDEQMSHYIGPMIDDSTALQIAAGIRDPISRQLFKPASGNCENTGQPNLKRFFKFTEHPNRQAQKFSSSVLAQTLLSTPAADVVTETAMRNKSCPVESSQAHLLSANDDPPSTDTVTPKLPVKSPFFPSDSDDSPASSPDKTRSLNCSIFSDDSSDGSPEKHEEKSNDEEGQRSTPLTESSLAKLNSLRYNPGSSGSPVSRPTKFVVKRRSDSQPLIKPSTKSVVSPASEFKRSKVDLQIFRFSSTPPRI